MAVDKYLEHRMVLRELPGLEKVANIAQRGGWQVVETNEGRADADYKTVITWGVNHDLWVTYIEDTITHVSCAVVFGTGQEAVDDYAKRVSFFLEPFSREQLLAPGTSTEARTEKARRIVRLTLAASAEFDEEIFAVISEASRDQDPQIRNIAAWSTVYLTWPQAEEMLRWMAENEPNEDVRNGVRGLLAQQ
ncbi:hypothetical protein HUT18_22400 [Streptomyces sp. NA04227]|uniref:hypothetical protein n=1 Tax=Streptomyces sp. NA04227 TaxID=2742136 RepID=UPI0015920193|nr:hypothetical protein [Streptomyces sp. NA04227]QKW08716.1 hypothetical protein HUT18_22400 [Streptomyces sp. NA04227]